MQGSAQHRVPVVLTLGGTDRGLLAPRQTAEAVQERVQADFDQGHTHRCGEVVRTEVASGSGGDRTIAVSLPLLLARTRETGRSPRSNRFPPGGFRLVFYLVFSQLFISGVFSGEFVVNSWCVLLPKVSPKNREAISRDTNHCAYSRDSFTEGLQRCSGGVSKHTNLSLLDDERLS